MAVDVKSRAKRYEKLDFLGEGQVRLSGGARKVLGTERRAASHCGKFSRGSQRPGHAPERPSPLGGLERDVDVLATLPAAANLL